MHSDVDAGVARALVTHGSKASVDVDRRLVCRADTEVNVVDVLFGDWRLGREQRSVVERKRFLPFRQIMRDAFVGQDFAFLPNAVLGVVRPGPTTECRLLANLWVTAENLRQPLAHRVDPDNHFGVVGINGFF